MPKERERKRGRRKPKTEDSQIGVPPPQAVIDVLPESQPVAGPSAGIHPARAALLKGERYVPPPTEQLPGDPSQGEEQDQDGQAQWVRAPRADQEFPFGVIDPDLKAYFRNVEEQIQDWEGTSSVGEEREDRKQFLSSVLGELRNNELILATDPECSVVLERLLPSMGDRGRRVLVDSLAGNWETLIRHRFASHVVQSWIRLGADALDREESDDNTRNLQPDASASENYSLPSMAELFTGLVESIRPTLPSLLTHAHASPPIRLLFLVLSPSRTLPDLDGDARGTAIRSKKSGKYRKNHAVQGKRFIGDEEESSSGLSNGKGKGKESAETRRRVTSALVDLAKEVRRELKSRIPAGEWRIMGQNVVGSAMIQLLLQLEVDDGEAEKAGSVLDHLTEGLVSKIINDEKPLAKDYIPSLLGTQPGIHLLEAILTSSPDRIFRPLWSLYFIGKIGRLAGHPLANYVVAQTVKRLDAEEVEGVVKECRAVAGGKGMIRTGRTSVLLALVERAVIVREAQPSVLALLYSALDIRDTELTSLVPALMCLKTLPTYRAILNGEDVPPENDVPDDALDKAAEEAAAAAAKYSAWQNRRTAKTATSELEPNIKGSLLLQGLLALEDVNDGVLESLFMQPTETLLLYATNPISSRFIDAILTQPAVATKWKRKLMLGYMGRYKQLAEDRIGSRVCDTIWDNSDGFMKEKIARSLAPHATVLANSPFGRFFAYKLKLQLLLRRPEEWKAEVLGGKRPATSPRQASTTERGDEALPSTTLGHRGNSGNAPDRKRRATGSKDHSGGDADAIDDSFANAAKKKSRH